MPRGSRENGTRRRPLLAAAAFLLVAGLMSTGPASAHTFTKTDGNDSPGKLDIRTASVGHATNKVVHTVQTHEGWTPKSLGNDSFFIVEIDKNFDNDFEQCAFIFFSGGRLRGSLTNCRRTFIRSLPVSKPSKASARITIPTANTGGAYRWVVFSFWSGLPARCSDLCFDAAPNRPPPILHDLTLPTVALEEDPIWVWTVSTTPDFMFSFSVDDAHSGVKSWKVERQREGETIWTEVVAGLGSGNQDLTLNGEPGRWLYRVSATDNQGNTFARAREVLVPTDDASLEPGAFSSPTTIADATAYEGSYTELDLSESFSYTPEPTQIPCEFDLVGPGGGDWVIEVTFGGDFFVSVDSDEVPDGPRQTILNILCQDSQTIVVTVTSGGGFGIDGIVPPT